MTTLMDLFGKRSRLEVAELIESYVSGGFLRRTWHPTEKLGLLNYTEKATFDKQWDEVTLNCRGLIYNTHTYEIVARPFPKFFNYQESFAAKFLPDEKVFVTDKADGSLGILYREPESGLAAIATRGSFSSAQAVHATRLLYSRYGEWTRMYEETQQNEVQVTLCFEIVYPENRIVLNYDGMDDLILLGGVAVPDGDILKPYTARVVYAWPGPVTKTIGTMSFREALESAPRQNAEGIVIRGAYDNRMVKAKQEDYIVLHRLITGLSERTVYEAMSEGKSIAEIQEPLPEEFYDWVQDVVLRLTEELNTEIERLRAKFNSYKPWLINDRRKFAEAVVGPDAWAMFAFWDNDEERVIKLLWKRMKPEAGLTPHG